MRQRARHSSERRLDLDRANSRYGQLLQSAAAARYELSGRLANLRVGVALTLAIAGVVGTAWEEVSPVAAVSASIWTIVSRLPLGRLQERFRRSAAVLEEQLETLLYSLPWSSMDVRAYSVEEVSAFGRKRRKSAERPHAWFPAVDGLPDMVGVLLCQRTQVISDIRVRRRYVNSLFVVATIWIAGGVLFALIFDGSVRELAYHWLIPSAAFLTYVGETVFSQRDAVVDRGNLMDLIRSVVDVPLEKWTPERERRARSLARYIQDRIFNTRLKVDRAPRWLYLRYEDRDREDIEAVAAEIRSVFAQR